MKEEIDMPFVTSRKMLLDAQAGGYAVGAFNVENMEMVQAVITAAEEQKAPVMLQTTPSTLKYASPAMFAAMVRVRAEHSPVDVALHLDHGDSFALAMRAIRGGYTSIMIDGSKKSFEENIALTKEVVAAASANDLPVEAELGKVGGKEDSLEVKGQDMTDPAMAKEFAERTGIDSLAVAIGTAHGIYKVTPKLDVDRLFEIRKVVSIPLVLHGASGLTDEDIRQCVKRGICKVNFATELRIAYSDAVKTTLKNSPEVFDPKKYGAEAKIKVAEQVAIRMQVCGCSGRQKTEI
jgi:tagatose 1,6-diphosphate aldolase GatY/KbaY